MLALNCGSATIKYLVAEGAERLAEGETELAGGGGAVPAILDGLRRRGLLERVRAVGHRVVHGGLRFLDPVLVDGSVLAQLDYLSELAPLHNPPAIAAIRAAREALPGIPQVATFDTSFHAGMPPEASTYAVPWQWTEDYAVLRYGFHGLAHRSMLAGAAAQLGRPADELRLVTFQLGSGCSACAIAGGRSLDTSMGLTPNEGLVMRTRSGDVDPTLVEYVARVSGQSVDAVLADLSERSGLAGVAGGDGDMRDLLAREAQGDERAALAVSIFTYRARKYLGAYLAVLGGADAVVFGGGVGENAADIRDRITAGLGLRVLVVRVDEEAVIVGDVERLLSDRQ